MTWAWSKRWPIYNAARHFTPDVDFIIDIGGQDMKCFKIRNGAVDSILLNEACSSGCGSFIETFAKALGYYHRGLFQDGPLRQAPGEPRLPVYRLYELLREAGPEGRRQRWRTSPLASPSRVVKNAIYKVIRAASADDLGKHIVVQGGTFLNDAVLRAFELEIGREVTRPTIAGIMGAYGAALAAKELGTAQVRPALCEGLRAQLSPTRPSPPPAGCCTNHCSLTVNTLRRRPPLHLRQPLFPALGQGEAADMPDLMQV